MKKILVTGGTGFLGSYIIKELVQKGYQVKAIRRGNKPLPQWIPADVFDRVEWTEGDVLDVIAIEEAMEDIDAVIHSAAVVSFSRKDRAQMYQVNVDGTANVVNMAIEKDIKRFVHISSVAAVGRNAAGGTVNEEKSWENSKVNTHYAISKHKSEMEVWRGIGEGLNAVILNPATIIGYGDWHNGSSKIFKQVHEGFKWYTSGVNGFVDVEDTARATVLMMETEHSAQRYIVNGDNWPFRKLQETIAHGFGKKPPYKKASPFLLGLAWRIERIKSFFTGKHPLLTKETAKVGLSQTVFDNTKLLAALPGFTFTPLETSVSNACELYKSDLQ